MSLKVVMPKPINFKKVLDELKKPFSDTNSLRGQANPKSRVAKSSKKAFADKIRNNIEHGDFAPLSETTIFIREKGLPPNSGYTKTSSKKPLVHTGNLLKSIKETETGVSMAHYGKYHLEDQTITANGFTNWFYKRYRLDDSYNRGVRLDGKSVPKRDFLKTVKKKGGGGDIEGEIRKHLEKVVGQIAKSMFGK